MFNNLREDLRAVIQNAAEMGHQWRFPWMKALFQMGTLAVVSYRVSHWVEGVRIPVIRPLLKILLWPFRRLVMMLTGVNIMSRAEIGPGMVIHSTYGLHVGQTRIGARCTLASGVFIPSGVRQVGDNVYFGAGAKVLGDTKIGNNVVVMPNSLVVSDVPDNITIVGVPARIKLPRGRSQRFAPAVSGNGQKRASLPESQKVLVKE